MDENISAMNKFSATVVYWAVVSFVCIAQPIL
jgi:hypothetical protein